MNTFFTFALVAVLVAAMVVYFGGVLSKGACNEPFTYMGSLAKKINPEETAAAMQEANVESQAAPIPPAPVTMNV
jgi:hypothetical protein